MLKERAKILALANQLLDAALAAGAAYLAQRLEAGLSGLDADAFAAGAVTAFAAAAAVAAARFQGLYESQRRRTLRQVTASAAWVQLKVALPVWLVAAAGARRPCLAMGPLYAGLALPLYALKYLLLHASLRYARHWGYDVRRLVIVGTSARARSHAGALRRRDEWGLHVIGHLDETALFETPAPVIEEPWRPGVVTALAPVSRMADILSRQVVDEVMFVLPSQLLSAAEPYLRWLETRGTSTTARTRCSRPDTWPRPSRTTGAPSPC